MMNDTFKVGELTCEFPHSRPGGRDVVPVDLVGKIDYSLEQSQSSKH